MDKKSIKDKLDKVAVFGPHDRMNYGDFLFPLMLDYAFSKMLGENIILKKYSLVHADFSNVGAFKSQSFNALKRDVDSLKINTIIIAGGESVGASWSRLLSFIYPWFFNIYTSKYFHRISRIVKFTVKIIFKNAYENPFVLDRSYFKNIKIIYNSVGGLHKGISQEVSGRFMDVDYFAVRERLTFDNSKEMKIDHVHLAPDSAIIMSDIYPLDSFSKERVINEYVFFQISKFKAKFPLDQIASEIQKILDNSHYDIVFCPIGIALGHEDDIILEEIYKGFFDKNERVHLIKNVTIEKIMSLIARAHLYIGTSLHGVITAMSYDVPFIGLNPSQKKVVNYILTWGEHEILKVCESNDFYVQFQNIEKEYEHLRIKSKELLLVQKEAYYKSVNNILNVILK